MISEILHSVQNDICHTEGRSLSTLFLLYRSQHHGHPLAFQGGHAFRAAEFFQFHGETEQLLLSLLGELNGASAEENGGLDLGSFLEEALRMFQLELEIVFVGVGAEADLLDDNLRSVGFHLLGFLPLLVQILLVIHNLAYRRVCLGADFHQVQFHLLCDGQGLAKRIDTLLGDVVPDQTNLRGGNVTVDLQGVFVLLNPLLLHRLFLFETTGSRFERRCDSFAPLKR